MSENPTSTPSPTRVRYWMVGLAMMAAILLYVDRACLSTASQEVRKDLQLTEWESGFALSAFFWTYALFQLPAGWLGDRYGARVMLTAYMILWSATTGFMGIANGFMLLVMMRFLCGAFEAGAYPVAAGIVRRWMPPHQRGVASSVVAVGGRFGGALAPIITAFLMLEFGWRFAFVFYGLIGVGVAMIFWTVYRDKPSQHPAVNEPERQFIEQNVAEKPSIPVAPPLGLLIRHRTTWLNALAQFAANFGWVLLLTLLPKYLDEIYKVPLDQRGWMQGMPLLVGIFGMLCGGVLTDWCAKKFGLRWGRTIPLIASRIAVSTAFLILIYAGADSLALVLVAFALVSFFTDIGTPATWALGQDVGGRHTGAVVGWANMWGNFGAAMMPLVFAWILEQYPKDRQLDGWIAAFWLCFGLQVVVAFCISGIDAREKLEP